LDTEFSDYNRIFATITGSHAYGFGSPLSDYDVHMVHMLSLEDVLGFACQEENIEKQIIDGDIELDIVSRDIKKFIFLLLKGNCNVLEDLYSPLVVFSSPVHEELKELGKGCITKMCAAHYKGMAHNQQRRINIPHG
jgi:uncharacterized protein